MAGTDKRSNRRVPVALRIKLRYPNLDAFVEKFATNVSSGGMFIAARTPKAVGTPLRFELQIADGSPVIAGEGVVRWIREFDERKPRSPHGMGIEFIKLTDGSQAALARIIDHRRARGLADTGIPLAPKSARTSAPTTGAAEPEPSSAAPEPVADATPEPAPEPAPAPEPEPEPAPEPEPEPEPESESGSAPIAAAPLDLASVPAPSLNLAWSDDALAAILGGADTAHALVAELARAREIAYSGRGLDVDVDELLVLSAAPVASSVADASAALAALVGAPAVAPRARRSELDDASDGGNGQSGPVVAATGEPAREAEAATEPEPEPQPAPAAAAAELAEITRDPYAEPDPYIEPDDEEADAADEGVPAPLEALADAEPPLLDADDELAIGTPPPADPAASATEPEPSARQDEAHEPLPEPADYATNGEATYVQPVLPAEVVVEPDPSPLPPPTADDLLAAPDAQLGAVEDPLSHELAVDAMDADDLAASVFDDLPSDSARPLDLDDDVEYSQPGYTQEGPTNVVEPDDADAGADADAVASADAEIERALDALGLESEEATAVKDDPHELDDGELDLGDLASDGDGEPDDDDPDKKKGFFKRIFGK